MSALQLLFRLPWLLLISILVLVLIGALALYSASEGSWSPWAERQLLRAAVGTVLLFLVAFIPTRWLYNWSYLVLVRHRTRPSLHMHPSFMLGSKAMNEFHRVHGDLSSLQEHKPK